VTDTSSNVVAITQLLHLYGLAVDSQRWELFDRILATDVDADYGATSHRTDLGQFKADFAGFHDPFDSSTRSGADNDAPGPFAVPTAQTAARCPAAR
jgi:hypothetical protein